MKKEILSFLCLLFFSACMAQEFHLISNNKGAAIYYQGRDKVVNTAIEMLIGDSKLVCGEPFRRSSTIQPGTIIAGTPERDPAFKKLLAKYKIDISGIRGKWEAFQLQVVTSGKQTCLFVVGSDPHGTAYGLLELSRIIGVTPWAWWADVTPAKKDRVSLPGNYTSIQSPSVQYRGIFLNDEDWGLNPWSSKTFEPDSKTLYPIKGHFKGAIGPKTYARIFELLLRLRANSIWPAMHEVTMPFYFVEGNREIAEKYGIYIGSSHCEPLARNSATEWDLAGKGDYNYLTNKANIISYWEDRLKELKNSNNIFTIGMRGKHDGPMQGVRTIEAYKNALEQVIPDQQALLKKYINPDISKIPQMLIPYKELLDVYNAGLKVPDYVTLMWCDDNYGYITHFPDETEQKRSGGNGIYYHISYWGRPHDYLWLGTASPYLLYQQLKLAYEKNTRKIWIVNVGDIKPIEYQTELFLDMAWDINAVSRQGVNGHLRHWLERSLGPEIASPLLPLLQEHYRLAYIRKPEFMGNTRTEESDPKYNIITDLPWNEADIKARLAGYEALSGKTETIASQVPPTLKEAYYELIQYPLQAAAQMNRKLLLAQLARHASAPAARELWQQSNAAYDSIAALTQYYNALNNGKWNRIMDYQPRGLPVFERVKQVQIASPLPVYPAPLYTFNGADYTAATAAPVVMEGLGYQGKAVALKKGSSITFDIGKIDADSVIAEVRLLPNHPVSGHDIRFGISVDGSTVKEISYKTVGRSEEWKENVLRNQAIRRITIPVSSKSEHTLTLSAPDEGVVLDQVLIYSK